MRRNRLLVKALVVVAMGVVGLVTPSSGSASWPNCPRCISSCPSPFQIYVMCRAVCGSASTGGLCGVDNGMCGGGAILICSGDFIQ